MPTTILTHNDLKWINITGPTQADIQRLADSYPQFHPLNLQDCLTELEYPKLDHFDHYLFLVVQMPYQDQQNQSLRPAEVDIFVTQNVLVTSHRGELKPLNDLFSAYQSGDQFKDGRFENSASTLLYRLLNALVDDCYPIVHSLGHNLHHIEENLFKNDIQHLLYEIARLRRDIIVLRGILNPQHGIISALIQGQWPYIHEHLDPYWGDIGNHLNQLCTLADQYAEIVNGLADTVDTLASHRIDDVVRLLTITTIVTLPVTLLATVFGMNVVMPFADHPGLFFGIIVAGMAVTAWLAWFLHNRKWL